MASTIRADTSTPVAPSTSISGGGDGGDARGRLGLGSSAGASSCDTTDDASASGGGAASLGSSALAVLFRLMRSFMPPMLLPMVVVCAPLGRFLLRCV